MRHGDPSTYKSGCRCRPCTNAANLEMHLYRERTKPPEEDHEIRIRMLGNSSVFVTCKCYDKTRAGWRGKSMRRPGRSGVGAPSWKSLGDFPVGSPTSDLIAAYREHLPPDHPDRRSPA